jgi:hypothetical protein
VVHQCTVDSCTQPASGWGVSGVESEPGPRGLASFEPEMALQLRVELGVPSRLPSDVHRHPVCEALHGAGADLDLARGAPACLLVSELSGDPTLFSGVAGEPSLRARAKGPLEVRERPLKHLLYVQLS